MFPLHLSKAFLLLALCLSPGIAQAQSTATVRVDTTHKLNLPERRNFAGANLQIFYTGTSYLDPKMQAQVRSLDLGWMRFPAGTVDDVYDWRTGDLREDWIAQFKGTKGVAYGNFVEDVEINRGKGLNKLDDYATFLATQRAGQGEGSAPTHTIGVINTFTDTPQSAAALVQEAAKKNLHVDVWELGNEPFFFEKFYPTATAYLDAVKPFADAMRKADPEVKVAVYLQRNDKWIAAMAAYRNVYWDQLYWHAYPSGEKGEGGGPETIAIYNGFLANILTPFVDGSVARFGPKMQLEASEFNIGPMRGGLYGAMFVAEFMLRLSADPHVTQAGMHTLIGRKGERDGAILPANDHIEDVLAAHRAHRSIDTSAMDFGYYKSPYGIVLELIDGIINTSDGLWPTAVSGGAVVATGTAGSPLQGRAPALYAQAYAGADKATHLLLTNKASSPQTFIVSVNGKPLQTEFTTRSMGGSGPEAKNSPGAPDVVKIVRGTASNQVVVPAYGVMDVSWK